MHEGQERPFLSKKPFPPHAFAYLCGPSAPSPIQAKQSSAPRSPTANQYSKSDAHAVFRAQSKQSQQACARPLERFVCRETNAC